MTTLVRSRQLRGAWWVLLLVAVVALAVFVAVAVATAGEFKPSAHNYDWMASAPASAAAVSAQRLAEKGYHAAVLDCGRRFADHELPRTSWNARKYVWSPRLGMRGPLCTTVPPDVVIVSGSGVGGCSLVYAGTL
jgi:hypothetical protein